MSFRFPQSHTCRWVFLFSRYVYIRFSSRNLEATQPYRVSISTSRQSTYFIGSGVFFQNYFLHQLEVHTHQTLWSHYSNKQMLIMFICINVYARQSCCWLWNASSNPFINYPLVIVCLDAHIKLPSAIRCATFWKVTFLRWSRRRGMIPQPQAWKTCALPVELLRHKVTGIYYVHLPPVWAPSLSHRRAWR